MTSIQRSKVNWFLSLWRSKCLVRHRRANSVRNQCPSSMWTQNRIIFSNLFTKTIWIAKSPKRLCSTIRSIVIHSTTIWFVLLCTKYNAVKYLKFANHFEIKKTIETYLVGYNELKCKKTYEGRICCNRTLIIANNLEMTPIYDKCI